MSNKCMTTYGWSIKWKLRTTANAVDSTITYRYISAYKVQRYKAGYIVLKVIFAGLMRQSVITNRSGCCAFWFTCVLWKDRTPRDSTNTKWRKDCAFKDCAWKIDLRFPLWLTWTSNFRNALEQSNTFLHTRLEPASHVRSMPSLIDSLYQFRWNSQSSELWD
jgi:hypothetical protein